MTWRERLGRLSDEQLMQAARDLDVPALPAEQRDARILAVSELERRHPEVDEAMDEWIEANDGSRESYVVGLERALRAVGALCGDLSA